MIRAAASVRTRGALPEAEVRCRTRVIRGFPNEASFRRLATALAADRNDQWAKRRYVVLASPTINVQNVTRQRAA